MPSESLRKLLNNTLDYAGLFPPAQLSLEESFSNYRTYVDGEYNWMLSKFICPAGKLDELGRLLKSSVQKVSMSVLLSDQKDVAVVSKFFLMNSDKVNIDTVELKISETLLEKPENIKEILENSSTHILSECSFIENIFYEVPLLSDWKSYLEPVVSDIAANTHCGFKLRTGSAEPLLVPTSEQIASVINTCRAANIKLKFTAGLHHPFRNTDPETGTLMHGFLNVFCAGVLTHAVGMPDEELTYLLDDFRPEHFSFSDTELTWFEYTAPIDKIEKARKNFITAFGSCNFEEPINDMKASRLL